MDPTAHFQSWYSSMEKVRKTIESSWIHRLLPPPSPSNWFWPAFLLIRLDYDQIGIWTRRKIPNTALHSCSLTAKKVRASVWDAAFARVNKERKKRTWLRKLGWTPRNLHSFVCSFIFLCSIAFVSVLTLFCVTMPTIRWAYLIGRSFSLCFSVDRVYFESQYNQVLFRFFSFDCT